MSNLLPTVYQQFIHKSRYARFNEELGRRETWAETCDRYIKFFVKRFPQYKEQLEGPVRGAILNLDVMPSMRAMWSAGKALEQDNVAGYNCSAVAVDTPDVFSEILYVLMCGAGVGFSVENKYISKLPVVPIYDEENNNEFTQRPDRRRIIIDVDDSKDGWTVSLQRLVQYLYEGWVPGWDVSRVRPAGSRLRTFGGRASGPEPLTNLFSFVLETFRSAQGRRLNSLEVHDIVCSVASAVISGGVRRSALISLSDLGDASMRHAKTGEWWRTHPNRAYANNSAVYDGTPHVGDFMREWLSLYDSKSGERGIFNRGGTNASLLPRRRALGYSDWLTNPCGEIVLRNGQFCNLTEAVVRPEDTERTLAQKVSVATFLGVLQSTLTDFNNLRNIWTANCEEERLLGVSLTGVMDNLIFQDAVMFGNTYEGNARNLLENMRKVAHEVAQKYARELGIVTPMAVTTVKPSGTVSQLVDCASGAHPRFSQYYVRAVRMDSHDPLCYFMQAAGVPSEKEISNPDKRLVFYFPVAAPEDSMTAQTMRAEDQYRLYSMLKGSYADHNVSMTVYMRDSEWVKMASLVYDNFASINGISFLPHTDHVYEQAPYTAIEGGEYNKLVATMPAHIDWEELAIYECGEDSTIGRSEFACSGEACEIVDVV